MGFWKNLFGKKEEKDNSKDINDLIVSETGEKINNKEVHVLEKRTYIDKPCEICQVKDSIKLGEIGYEKWTKKQGKYFHRSCFKKTEVLAKQQGRI